MQHYTLRLFSISLTGLIISVLIALGLLAVPDTANAAFDSAVAPSVSAIYDIADVSAENAVTAGNISQARDKTVMQAQHLAFTVLLQRLNADQKIAEQQNDKSIANLVKSFEVQNENASSARYSGIFTVHFSSHAVRNFLDSMGAAYTEARSRPVLVLPITVDSSGRAILWEERTLWREIWDDEAARYAGVPIVLPAADVEDVTIISTQEVLAGTNLAQFLALARRYGVEDVLIAVLKNDAAVELHRINTNNNGNTTTIFPLAIPIPPPEGDDVIKTAMVIAAQQARAQLEKEWQTTRATSKGGLTHMKIIAEVDGPAALTAMRQRLMTVGGISGVSVLGLRPNVAELDVIFSGSVSELQAAIAAAGLQMTNPSYGGSHVIRSVQP